jgi:tetratricopeptide (TPR) repeat protein
MEERYYYKGKTNQQLQHYNEVLQCYNKSLELNPNFEPAKKEKKEVKKIILEEN